MHENGPPTTLDDDRHEEEGYAQGSLDTQSTALLRENNNSINFGYYGKAKLSRFHKQYNETTGGLTHLMWITVIIAFLILATIVFHNFAFYTDSVASSEYDIRSPAYELDPDWDFRASPKERVYHWVIEDKELNPDGVFRPMMVINGAFPGPLIECNEGDTLTVHVHNKAVNATSIHWHGLFQNGTNWMDGTVGVTNCPIAHGQVFTYKFTVQGQSGTYHYHAHQAMQASDGIVGPLIIHGRHETSMQKLSYSSDQIIMVQDHYHDLTSALLMKYLESDRENVEPVPDSALINGRNIRDCDSLTNRRCDNTSLSHTTFRLASNKNHRLRFINTGALAEFQIQVDEHEFAVTEVDGVDIIPSYYHRLTISPAQRYSIVLTTNHSSSDTFWLRARMVTLCFKEENPFMEPEIRAVIQYTPERLLEQSSAIKLPNSKDWPEVVETECRDMNASELVPARKVTAPAKADAFFYIRSNFEIGDWRLSRGFFNRSSWRPDLRSPTLHRISDGLLQRHSSLGFSKRANTAIVNEADFDTNRELVIQTTGTQVIDLLIQNFDDGNHPMHLHGHKYFVLASGRGGFDRDTIYPSLNLTNPLRRDTATLESYSWLLIRIIADNPGVWALHCHISWHVEAGLLMQLLTRTDVVERWNIPSKNRQLCNAQHLDRGSTPGDEIFFGNQTQQV